MLKTILIITLLILSTSAHTFLTHPPPRTNPTKPFTFGRGCSSGKDCFGPCESTTEEIIAAFGNIDEYTKWVPTFSGGEVLNVQWPRLNHPVCYLNSFLINVVIITYFVILNTTGRIRSLIPPPLHLLKHFRNRINLTQNPPHMLRIPLRLFLPSR